MSDYDLICTGRSSLDLFSNTPGAVFSDVTGFDAFVGGSPTNICVAARRLGLRTALMTGVGDDYISSFILKFLKAEGIETRYIAFKPGYRTNTVLAAIQPPEDMQFVAMHHHNADLELTVEDMAALPLKSTRALLISGMALLRDPSRTATQFAAERAHEAGATVFMDLDYRVPMWGDARVYGVATRRTLPLVDVAIGTEAEARAAAGVDDLTGAVTKLLSLVGTAVIVKQGAAGSTVYLKDGTAHQAAPYPVQVVNFLGAGDAFAGALIQARLSGQDWPEAARFANAAGAYIAARQGTANVMPTRAELDAFIDTHGDPHGSESGG